VILNLGNRFWSKVDKTEACWNWTAAKKGSGYGKLRLNKTYMAAHRAAYASVHGPIPAGKIVLHACDNPACVRPDHLRLGTQRENIEDMYRKGRNWQRTKPWVAARGDRNGARLRPETLARGEANPNAKLSRDSVVLIWALRDRGETCASLGRQFGVSDVLISKIGRREIWRHVT
jgi:hypothetical protein